MATSLVAAVLHVPHPLLTPIDSKPKALSHSDQPSQGTLRQCSLCTLSQWFLGMIVMAAAPYLLRAGEPFLQPNHPGTQLTHSATAMQSQITTANRPL